MKFQRAFVWQGLFLQYLPQLCIICIFENFLKGEVGHYLPFADGEIKA